MTTPDPDDRQLALVLEDDCLIAEGLSEQLKAFGFRQVIAFSSCGSALDYLDTIKPALPNIAVLDVQLGRQETSLAVAQWLKQHEVPFFLLSGYGAANKVSAQIPGVPTLRKPVIDNSFETMLQHMLDGTNIGSA